MKRTLLFSIVLFGLLLSGCRSAKQDSPSIDAEETKLPEITEEKGEEAVLLPKETESTEKESESQELTAGFYEIVPSFAYDGYEFVTEETARSTIDFSFACPAYLPEDFQRQGGVFVQEDRGTVYTLRFWYNVKDHAVLEIYENRAAPDEQRTFREYYYADMVYLGIAHEGTGFRYYATWWDCIDRIDIQGYMLFAEESYEPECHKIIDSIAFPEE